MKKFFYSVLAVATMLFTATSCSQDDEIVSGGTTPSGDTQKVTFKVEMPGEGVGSRAIADGVNVGGGNQADKLIWALYEKGKDANRLDFGFGTASEKVDGKQEFTAEISMVKGLTYNVLFFAYDEDGCVFQLNTQDPDLTALKLKDGLQANVEGYDAFVKCHEHTVKSGNEVTTVELKRPFAQINAATTVADLDRAKKLQAVVTKSELVIANVPTKYNVLTGEATENADLTYSANDILNHYVAAGETTPAHPNEDITVDNVGYKYLTMAYVLAGETATSPASNHSATFNFYRGESGDDLMRNIEIINLPIQRNYRTNVIGDLLTETESFKIVIDEEFENDHNIYEGGVSVATAQDLQTEIDNAQPGTTIIKFDGDITGEEARSASNVEIIINQKEGVNLIIDGCGYKFDGKFDIYGHARFEGKETLKFTNINFEHTDNSSVDFISCNTTDSEKRYAHNVIVENCTFVGNGSVDSETGVMGMRYRQCYYMEVKNSTFKNMYGIIWATGGEGITLDNVTSTDSKNGASFGTTTDLLVENSNIEANVYGIRVDASVATTLTVKNTAITAKQPIIARKTTVTGDDKSYNVVLEGQNTLETSELYQVVFTNGGDDEAYVEPTGTYSITGAEDFNVYPGPIKVATADDLVAALEKGCSVVFTSDIKIDPANMSNAYGTTGINVKNGQAIDGGGYTLDIRGAGGTWDSGISTTGGLIKNIKVTGSFRGIFVNHNSTHSEKVVLEKVVLDGTTYTISCDQGTNNGLEATDCTFKGWTSYAATLGNAKFTKCYFGEGNNYAYCRPYAPTEFVDCEFEEGYEMDTRAAVTFENCTLNGVALTSENLATLVTSNIANATVK